MLHKFFPNMEFVRLNLLCKTFLNNCFFFVLSFAQQKDLGFAKSPNRLNVALSRAKRLLIIVGNSDLFRTKEIYDNVYRCIENSPYGKIIKAEEL